MYVMDSIGRIIVINKDLDNDQHGIIFSFKCTLYSTQFFLLPIDPHLMPQPVDQIKAFKRDKLLEPLGYLITITEKYKLNVNYIAQFNCGT